ncbi:MAG: hypothetical protein PHC28_05155 [Flavobacterium sp.]|uniref:hypothetical protein n=1 Tax=Flavobacterium sp. TaxID=239 RepID=UPI00261616C8|nr:hypothetical protein [Flavobacterium sp.]MDD5149854.1 hypothetical protein [Flavobacterium sp.]
MIKYILIGVSFCAFLSWYIITYKKRKIRKELKKRVLKDGTRDYKETAQNIVNSISKSKKLYKELIVKIHPDKIQTDKREKAQDISARLTQSKRNYSELSSLEIEINNFLKEQNGKI